MSLLHLPPETLIPIFKEIGSRFFHEGLGRLTVCEQWFEFALPTYFKCITLDQNTLRNFITSGVTERPSRLQNNLETLHLELRGDGLGIAAPKHTQESNALVALTRPNEAPPGNNPTEISITTTLNKDLDQLASIITQKSHRLHTLRMRAWGFPRPKPFDNAAEDYLLRPTIQTLLSVGNLRVLVLDLSSGFLNSSSAKHGQHNHHICPAIGALLCTLRTLHLRLCSICPDVLKPQEDADMRFLPLKEVVINLSLMEKQLPGIITSAAHSKRCSPPQGGGGGGGGGLLQLKADLYGQAEALGTQMVSAPKVLRILTHSLPRFETYSLDVLSGKTVILEDGSAWDEDAKTVEDEGGSETESEITSADDVSLQDE